MDFSDSHSVFPGPAAPVSPSNFSSPTQICRIKILGVGLSDLGRKKPSEAIVSCVQLFVTPWTVAHQAPLSMEFFRQEYWNGLPCPPPGDLPNPGIVQFSSVAQLCPTLCDPMNCSMPGLPVHHQLLELAQTHVHRVGDAIQPSHALSSPSRPAFNLSSIRVF